MEKISYDENSSVRFKNIKRFETELKWIKLLQTPFPLGFNDNIYHEGNISKMPDFDVLTLSESRKRKSRSHGIRKKGNDKRKRCATMKLNTSLNVLAVKLRIHGRHPMLSYLSSLPIAVLRSLDTEANRFYDRNHQMYDAALLTRCYTQISKYNVGLKTLLSEGLSEPEFYGDLVYKLKKLIGSNDFSFQFRKIITRYRRIGYNLNVMRQSACLVFNPITVDNYAAFFNCTPVGRASDSMMAPT